MSIADPVLSASVAEIVLRWQGRLTIPATGAFDPRSEIPLLPHAVAQRYPALDEGDLRRLTAALCVFSDAIVASDDLIDYAAHDPSAVRGMPRIALLYAEAYRTFGALFGGRGSFWDRLTAYFVDYADALASEARHASGEAPWETSTAESCLAIARGKNGLVRLVAAAVGALAADERDVDGCGELLLRYFVANQMLDDLNDWREDIRDGNISLVLRLACASRPRPEDAAAVGRAIYAGGHADRVLEIAEQELDAALHGARELRLTALEPLLERRRARVSGVRAKLRAELGAAAG
jgi:hypothetical protein